MYYKINVIRKLCNHWLALTTQSNSLLQTDEPLSYKKLKINRPTNKGKIMATTPHLDVVKPKLNNVEPDIKLYISYLEKEISKIVTKNAKLYVANVSMSNKVKALEKEIVKLTKHTDNVTIVLPYKIGGPLPTHVQTANDKYIEIFYKHDK